LDGLSDLDSDVSSHQGSMELLTTSNLIFTVEKQRFCRTESTQADPIFYFIKWQKSAMKLSHHGQFGGHLPAVHPLDISSRESNLQTAHGNSKGMVQRY